MPRAISKNTNRPFFYKKQINAEEIAKELNAINKHERNKGIASRKKYQVKKIKGGFGINYRDLT